MKTKISLAFLSLGLWACSSDDEVDFGEFGIVPVPTVSEITLTDSDTDICESMNSFGIDFFKAAAQDKDITYENPNLSVSPLSLTLCMSLFANTIDEENSATYYNALGAESLDELNATCRKLMTFLPDKSNQESLELVNAVWHKPTVAPSDEYTKILEENFFSKPYELDFTADNAIDVINSWAAKATHGMIPNFLKSLDLQTTLYLANAMYFNGKWSSPFDAKFTKPAPFYADGKEYKVQMMQQTGLHAPYAKNDKFEVLGLGYKGQCAFFAFLPAADNSLDEFIKSFDTETFQSAIKNMIIYSVDVKIPKFESDSEIYCNSIFENLGMDINAVKYTGFNKELGNVPQSVDMKQNTAIILDEEGTRAAAVTGIGMTYAKPFPAAEITFDRPFIYLIRNAVTGSILMMGQYTRPE